MRKLTILSALTMCFFVAKVNATTPAVKSSTAWFNNETFESYTAGIDLKTAGTDPYSDWTGTNVMAGIQQLSSTPTSSTASNLVFGFPTGTTIPTTFADGSTAGTLNISKAAFNGGALSGYVYVKTSYYFQTYGCYYVLKNTAGEEVFRFGGLNNNANAAMYCTGVANTTVAMGNRNNWGDIEFVLDLNNKLVKKVTFSYLSNSASPKSYTDIALTNGDDVKSLYLSVSRRSGLDNTTIGQLVADNIQDITSNQTNHQTADGSVNTTLNVTPISTAMGLALPFTGENTDVDVVWTISDWGTLSEADKSLVSITRSETDYSAATLTTTGSITTDADITISATVADGATLTKVISLKSNSIEGVKSSLLSEITTATNLRDAVTASNPYITSLKSDLTSVINAGQSAYDNVASTINDVTTATSNLVTAKETFVDGMTIYNTYISYIETVKAGRDTVGVNQPSVAFFPAIKSTLNVSIAVAEGAKDTVSSVGGIANATSLLTAAYLIFNTERPTFYTLSSQIAAATSRYNVVFPRKGDTKFLQFPAANVDALYSAIDAGNITLNTGTTALAMTDETTNVSNALTTFNSAARVAPSTNDYRIFSYGSSGGDGNEVKKVLFAHKMNNTPAYRLAWCSLTDAKALALGDSALWTVAVGSANNKYTLYNKALGQYLNGTGFSETAVEYSINEVKSQNGFINGFIDWSTKLIADPNYIYALVSTASLEIRADSVAPYSNLRTGSTADRYRFAFQFEEAVAPVVSTTESSVKVFACNAGSTDNATLTLNGDDLYDASISLSISGADAAVFSVSPLEIAPTNTYVRNNTVTITYSPLSGASHSAKLSIAVTGGNTLEYDLSGSVITSVVGNNNFDNDIYVKDGKIHFNATTGEQVNVFTATGIKITGIKAVEGLNSISVNNTNGIYIVQVGNRTAKVVL